VRRAIVRPAVRLDLDDPALAAAGLVVANESEPEQDASDVGRWARELGPLEDAQAGVPL
jgi:hypothetical protein